MTKKRGRPPVYDLSEYHCWNIGCDKHKVKGAGNIVMQDKGTGDRAALLKCTLCGTKFCASRGTLSFMARDQGSKDRAQKIEWALNMVGTGDSLRKVEKELGIGRRAIKRIVDKVGQDSIKIAPPTITKKLSHEKSAFCNDDVHSIGIKIP